MTLFIQPDDTLVMKEDIHKIVSNIVIEHPLTLQSDSCLSKIVLNQVLSLHQMKSMERMGDCEMELKRKWFLNASWT